jgi:glycosyltransferase involved in cell wall biosynthesis
MRSVLRLGFISSFLPKKCGIANFSRDLMEGISYNFPSNEIVVAAAEKDNESYKYPKSVVSVLKTNDINTYLKAANKFNKLKLDAVMLQHEFGLFGGKWAKFIQDKVRHNDPTGDNIFALIDNLTVPIISTLHTVLPYPDPSRKAVIRKIAEKSAMLVTMSQDSKRILCADYQIAENKIVVIPHGVPKKVKKSRKKILKDLRLDDKSFYLVITGLISANKGIDLVIKAMPRILDKHPNVRLLVVGQTHPQVLAHEGEGYRNSLMSIAKKLKVQSAITYINKYLETEELMEYISAADIYLTTHRDPEQSASGTLAYAVGTDRLTISTPYRYAQELLGKNRGFLVPFEDPVSIADTVNRLIDDNDLRKKTRQSLKIYSDKMAWPVVGKAYLKIIEDYVIRP